MFRRIKYFIQRGRRGWADDDVYCFFYYLSDMLPAVIREVKKNVYSCPIEFYDEENKNDECHKWKEILEEIAQGFEAAKKVDGVNLDKFRKDGDILRREHSDEQLKQLTQKFERGMDLFKKHYFSLWD